MCSWRHEYARSVNGEAHTSCTARTISSNPTTLGTVRFSPAPVKPGKSSTLVSLRTNTPESVSPPSVPSSTARKLRAELGTGIGRRDPLAESRKEPAHAMPTILGSRGELTDRGILALHPLPRRRPIGLDRQIDEGAKRAEWNHESVRDALAEQEAELTEIGALGAAQPAGVARTHLRERQEIHEREIQLGEVRPDHGIVLGADLSLDV